MIVGRYDLVVAEENGLGKKLALSFAPVWTSNRTLFS